MNNFIYDIPTKVYFGQGQIVHLPELIQTCGSRVLLVYGGGSVKKTGVYDTITHLLRENGIEWQELSGVQSNPKIGSVREGVRLVREHQLDCVLAVGGGSTLDCSKAICAGVPYAGDPWELVLDRTKVQDCLPLITVLTMAATGSEMDNIAVISNPETKDKRGFSSYGMYPRFSILDPAYTFTVPRSQTAAGTADIMSHIMESYFDQVRGASVQDGLSEALLKTCIQSAPVALAHPDDYEARANLMWASSLAINGLISYGEDAAWAVHPMEHELSAFYDITHGAGLALLTPYWMQYVLREETLPRFVEYGVNVWGIDPEQEDMAIARQAITKTREFFDSIGMPSHLSELDIDDTHFDVMAMKAAAGGLAYGFVPLDKQDVRRIYEMAL